MAACEFPRREGPITEATPPDGRHIYAWSKREGERLVRGQRGAIPTCIVRFGAVYSDWCEYPPLYVFLNTWLGGSWRARILAGRGRSAIPYIHIRDVVTFFRRLLLRHERLGPGEILIASTTGCTSHRTLFELRDPFVHRVGQAAGSVSRPLCGLGMLLMSALGRIRRADAVRAALDVPLHRPEDGGGQLAEPHAPRLVAEPRYQMERRLPFLIERFKSEPVEWHARNAAVMRKDIARPDLAILKALVTEENQIIGRWSRESARRRPWAACRPSRRWNTPSWSGWCGCCTGCC